MGLGWASGWVKFGWSVGKARPVSQCFASLP